MVSSSRREKWMEMNLFDVLVLMIENLASNKNKNKIKSKTIKDIYKFVL